jgi:SAM-dependent methyltransferase
MYPVVNTEQAQAWNGYEDFHWADNHDRWNGVSAAVNDDLLAATGIDDRTRILDIGCGTGQTTRGRPPPGTVWLSESTCPGRCSSGRG